jgi:hypothetical protein
MKKLTVLPLAAFLLAACSESTAPESTADLTPVYGQNPPAESPPTVCSGGAGCATWDDATGIAAADAYGISANGTTTTSPAPASEKFMGRFATETVTLNLPNAGSSVTITFNLYIIGDWYGQPRKRVPHLWELSTQCGSNTGTTQQVIYASFANRDGGGPQSYPNNYPTKKTWGAFTGHTALNALDYLNGGTQYFTTRTGAVADVTYNIQKTVANNCPEGEFTFVMRGHNLENIATRSWGIDNLSITSE